MEKTNIPVLEVEKLIIQKNGRGFIFHESGRMTQDWAGYSATGGTQGRMFLIAPSCSGWLKIGIISGSTFGPTGASYFVPLFKTRTTYSSV